MANKLRDKLMSTFSKAEKTTNHLESSNISGSTHDREHLRQMQTVPLALSMGNWSDSPPARKLGQQKKAIGMKLYGAILGSAKFVTAIGVLIGAIYLMFPAAKRSIEMNTNFDAWYQHADFGVLASDKRPKCNKDDTPTDGFCIVIDINNFFYKDIQSAFISKATSKAEAAEEVMEKFKKMTQDIVILNTEDPVPGREDFSIESPKQIRSIPGLELETLVPGKVKTIVKENECLFVNQVTFGGPISENTDHPVNVFINGTKVDCL